jgi:hypothetical protein
MAKVAEKLCMERAWHIRTNGDQGASDFFESGLSEAARNNKDNSIFTRFLPAIGHNGHQHGLVVENEALKEKARSLLMECGAYAQTPRFIALHGDERNDLTNEEISLADLHTRYAFQLLGESLNSPATMVVCWTPDGIIDVTQFEPDVTGSTGLAISLAQAYSIPVFNLQRADHLQRICKFIGEPVPSSA